MEDSKASLNKTLLKIEFEGIPSLPRGEAKLKFNFSIDMEGNAIIEQLCLTSGKKVIRNVKNLNLVEN